MKPQVIRDGEECIQIYAHTDKLVFSVSTLLPGQKACLEKGDSLLIPPGASHYSINAGEETSVAAWACAPHL